MSLESLATLTVDGITLGMIYALVALGYTMVYGVLQLINFAHGEVFTSGAFLGALFLTWVGVDSQTPVAAMVAWLILAFLFSIVLTSVLGAAIERLAYRPLRGMARIAPLLSAIGVSIFLQNLIMLAFGADSIAVPQPAVFVRSFIVGGVHVRYLAIFIVVLSAVLMVALSLFVRFTKLGKAMRATSQDAEAAEMMGIPANRTIVSTFVIGSALAAVAGLLVGMYYGSIRFNMGFLYGIKAFAAAVVGGVGNIPGAVLGALLLGLAENYGVGLPLGIIGRGVLVMAAAGIAFQVVVMPRRVGAEIRSADASGSGGRPGGGRTSGGDREPRENLARLCYLGGLPIDLWVLRTERSDSFIRGHARRAARLSTINACLLLAGLLGTTVLAPVQVSSEWKDVTAFLLLILVLILRPSGLLGERLPEKV